MVTYLSEGFSGSNGSAWNGTNWVNVFSGSGASATIQSNKGRQNAGTPSDYTGQRTDRWNGANHANFEMIGKLTFVNSVDGNAEVWLRASPTAFDGTGYFFQVNATGSNNVIIGKGVSYSYTYLTTMTRTITVGTTYGFRFYAVGTTLKAKFWDASGAEPGAYDLTATDSAVAAAGWAHLNTKGGGSPSFQADWDDLILTDGTGNSFTFTASVATNGVLSRVFTKNPFTGSTTPAGTYTKLKVVIKTLTGSVSAVGAHVRSTIKLLKGSSTPVGAYKKTLYRTFVASSSAVGTFRKASIRLFTATVSTTGTFVSTFLGRVFGLPGVATLRIVKAAEAFVRIRRT